MPDLDANRIMVAATAVMQALERTHTAFAISRTLRSRTIDKLTKPPKGKP